MSKFLPFDEALAVAQSLGLASQLEWKEWCKEGMRPPNVPAHPERTYEDGGWQGWGHWLGTGNARNTTPPLPFVEALAVARSLNLANAFEWREWCKEGMCPPNVPSNPQRTYKDGGWQGWVHWLGSGNIKKASKFAPFGQALTFAQSLNLSSRTEWKVWCKEGMCPPNVPRRPDLTYKDHGWQGWGHWLDSSNLVTKQFLPFDEALAMARSLGLVGQKEWQQWSKEGLRPRNVPAAPNTVYKDHGWRGWGHWLGTGNTQPGTEQFLPFAEALAMARSFGLAGMASAKEWKVWCKEGMRPRNMPAHPNKVYKDHGWQGWGHWLGTGNQPSKDKKVQFLPFDEALRVARSLRLNTSSEWKAWCRTGVRPANVPATPDKVYVHDGWMGWVHFLYHANLDAAPAPAAALPGRKHAAAGFAGAASGNAGGKSRGKRQRR